MVHVGSFACAFAALALLCSASVTTAQAAFSCTAQSATIAAPVVELYTSEGCNSCPPADQWLSRLKADPSIVALAFHVDYWDRLGWKDRFGSPAYTQRQAQQQVLSGARFSYTPQVIINGADRTDWSRASVATAKAAAATVDVQLTREGDRVTAIVKPLAGAPAHLSAYWAVTEQGHASAVKAGENAGVTLNHDYVVRDYRQVAKWSPQPDARPATLQFDFAEPADPAHPRSINLVVVNADSGRPVQAAKLNC